VNGVRNEGEHPGKQSLRPRFFVEASTFLEGGIAENLVAGWGEDRPVPQDVLDALGRHSFPLTSSDAHHARSVLRMRKGDRCEIVVVPFRVVFEAAIHEIGDEVTVIVGGARGAPPTECRLVLIQALPKPKKVDGIVRRSTEVGVDHFLLFPSDGSPSVPLSRLEGRVERWERVAEEAAKQSRQVSLPDVGVVGSLGEAAVLAAEEGWISVVTDPYADHGLEQVMRRMAPPLTAAVAVWVGPEGGWSDEEISYFRRAEMEYANLGWRVLRTESAGPVSAALVRSVLSD